MYWFNVTYFCHCCDWWLPYRGFYRRSTRSERIIFSEFSRFTTIHIYSLFQQTINGNLPRIPFFYHISWPIAFSAGCIIVTIEKNTFICDKMCVLNSMKYFRTGIYWTITYIFNEWNIIIARSKLLLIFIRNIQNNIVFFKSLWHTIEFKQHCSHFHTFAHAFQRWVHKSLKMTWYASFARA